MMEAEAARYVELLPRTLTWATSGEEIRATRTLHLRRLRRAFGSFLERLDGRAPQQDIDRLTDLASAATKAEFDQVLLCPNVAHLLMVRRADGNPARTVAAGFALLGVAARPERQPGSCWCPSGNAFVDEDGSISRWPILGGQTGVDLDSPDEVAIGSDLPSAVTHWRPLDQDKRAATLLALDEAYISVRDTRPSLGRILENCAAAVVLRQSEDGRFASFSSAQFIGRITLVNPQLIGRPLLAEALLHEAIHTYLYMLEPNPFWGLTSSAGGGDTTIRSPWTGRELPLYAFLHACFVWYGLFFFWARLMERDRAADPEVLRHLGYAATGFSLPGSLVDLVNAGNRSLVRDEVLCAIAAMQRQVISVAEA